MTQANELKRLQVDARQSIRHMIETSSCHNEVYWRVAVFMVGWFMDEGLDSLIDKWNPKLSEVKSEDA